MARASKASKKKKKPASFKKLVWMNDDKLLVLQADKSFDEEYSISIRTMGYMQGDGVYWDGVGRESDRSRVTKKLDELITALVSLQDFIWEAELGDGDGWEDDDDAAGLPRT